VVAVVSYSTHAMESYFGSNPVVCFV